MTTLTVLGSAGGAPTRTNPASGYLVESGDTTLWLDAGTGTFMELARHTDPGTLSGVLLSHILVDHCTDVFGLYGYLAFGPSGIVPVPVFAPAGAAEHLSAFARAGEEHVFHTVLDLVDVAPGSAVTVGGVSIRFGRAAHPVPALVARFDTPGGSLVYSGDTGPGSDLVELARGADVLLCEATIAGERSAQTYPYHLTAGEAGRIAAEADVSFLVITHLASGVDADQALDEAAAEFRGPINLAAPGSTFTIGGTT
ncbi:MAG: MBL fold metallo-hydrolase [Acidimicrobiia bacterium]